jgi:hypothetical protein
LEYLPEMILTIVPTVADAQYKVIILFCVKVNSHLHFEIQALDGHIDRFNGDSQQKIENERYR